MAFLYLLEAVMMTCGFEDNRLVVRDESTKKDFIMPEGVDDDMPINVHGIVATYADWRDTILPRLAMEQARALHNKIAGR